MVILQLATAGMPQAQTLDGSPLKEWYYSCVEHHPWASNYYYQHLVTAGDTIIMDKECTVVKDSGDPTVFYYWNMGKSSYFLRREPDRLLWYNETLGDFTVLHDYAAQAGESWTIQVDSCSFDVVVDSTDETFFGGKSHRVLYVHDDNSYYNGCIIEDVGHTGHFFPSEVYWICHDSFVCGGPGITGIRCVIEDGAILYHEGMIACDSVYSSHIGVAESEETLGFTAFPIPTKDFLRVDHPDPVSVEGMSYTIFDCRGIRQSSGTFGQSEVISVAHLPKGLYLLELSCPNTKNIFLKFTK